MVRADALRMFSEVVPRNWVVSRPGYLARARIPPEALTQADASYPHCSMIDLLKRSSAAIDRDAATGLLGKVQRRRGERRLARKALTEGLAIFRDHGATLWAERATEELRRIPIRRGAQEDLTPTEEQVAELVGAGRSNREVARALFMSPKTVEANLTRIYGKLGIRSRSELGVRMLERRKASGPAKK
jgi:DNA-binding CsgD family transcriptional regulator